MRRPRDSTAAGPKGRYSGEGILQISNQHRRTRLEVQPCGGLSHHV